MLPSKDASTCCIRMQGLGSNPGPGNTFCFPSIDAFSIELFKCPFMLIGPKISNTLKTRN